MIIAITGTPGVGKTTLAKLLSAELGVEYVDFESLLIEKQLYTEYDEESQSYVINIEAARNYFKNYEFTDSILDGHNVILIYPCEKITKIILLRCSPYILYIRLIEKGFPERKVLENVQAEILDLIASDVYSKCDSKKVLQVDVSKGVTSKLNKIMNFIRSEIGHEESDIVDWLKLIKNNGDLGKFFRY